MSKFHPLKVATVARETRDAIVLTFDVPPALRESFRFVQGQHLTLRADIGGEDVRRSYSICSAVHDPTLRIAVKKAPGGVFVLGYELELTQDAIVGRVVSKKGPEIEGKLKFKRTS